MDDLRELLRVGSTPQVRLVMLSDRSPEDSSVDGYTNERVFNLDDWSDTLLLELGREEATIAARWGEQNMADGQTLRRFLSEAARRYPARRYGLILCDHGMGWSGICSDDSAGDEDFLTVDEMAEALKASSSAYGGRLELIGFDACLMSSVEVAAAVAPYARVMVGSEELEPLSGWDYVPLVRALEARPDLDGAALGKLAVQSFRRSFENATSLDVRNEGRGTTLSVIDLDAVRPLLAALDELGAAGLGLLSSQGRAGWLTLARARSRSEQYGSEGTPEDPGIAAVDLGDLAGRLQSAPALRKACDKVAAALRECVIAEYHGEVRPAATGLSVFFPASAEMVEAFPPAEYTALPGMPSRWQELMLRYTSMVRPASEEPLLSSLTASAKRLHIGSTKVTLKARVEEPTELDTAWFVVLAAEGDDLVVLGQEPVEPAARLTFTWDGSLLALSSGDTDLLLPLSAVDGALRLARAELKQGQGGWQEVQLHLEGDRLLYATVQGSGGRRQVRIAPGDRLRAVHLVFDEEGVADTATYEDEVLVVKDDLALTRVDLAEETYQAGFLLYDFDGDRDLQTVEVRLVD